MRGSPDIFEVPFAVVSLILEALETPRNKNLEYFQAIFEAVPVAVLVVDQDVRVLDYNVAAQSFLGSDKRIHYRVRGGEALHCLQAYASPAGCGHGPACDVCIVRNSVKQAMGGDKVTRRKARMQLSAAGAVREIYLLVTAAAMVHDTERLVLLTLEDVSELIQVQSLLPMCAWCKKVRTGTRYWQSMESYFHKHVDVEFSHGICEECLEKRFPPSQR